MATQHKMAGMGSLSADKGLYRCIIESATGYAIVTTDLRGTISSWNRGAELLLGYQPEDILGEEIGMLFTADERIEQTPFAERHSALFNGPVEDARWHVRKDGSQVWVKNHVMPLFDDAQVVIGFVKVMHDATKDLQEQEAVRASQERLKLILESAIDYAIFTFDADGTIVSWNTGAQKIFGYAGDEIANRDARILFPAQEQANGALQWEMQTALRNGRAENARIHVRKDGSEFWGSGLTMPLRADQDRPGYLMVMRDDTDRHEAEQHQQMLNKEMNHRVSNSLTLVSGMLGMQARSTESAEIKQVLNDAKARVTTIAQVHDHLWRQTHGETVDLADFLGQLCVLLGGASNHRLLVDCASCIINTDRAVHVALLVNELVANAVKHAYPDGNGDILVEVTRRDSEIRLVVRDHGVGLPANFSTGDHSGRSLGMKILGGLVQQLRGKLTTEAGKPGTIFTIAIPVEA